MTTNAGAFQPALDALENDYKELEQQAQAVLISINLLRKKVGLPPRDGGWSPPSGGGGGGGGLSPVTIHSDQFVGKKMASATREYLEMRKKAGGDAPASVREIFDSLKKGGFAFGSKDDDNAIVVLRAMLRKGTGSAYHKLNDNKYGLRSWYPDLPKAKANATDEDNEADDTDDMIDEAVEKKDATKEAAA